MFLRIEYILFPINGTIFGGEVEGDDHGMREG
jgi:hypothetical protein